jgi:hypothetical protein
MTPDEKADLILHALSGEHLHGFLPGNDHKAAISQAASGYHGWGGSGEWGQVTRKGIGLYPDLPSHRDQKNARVFITWAEVFEIVAKGCSDGRRESYEAAYAAWGEHNERFPAWDPERRTRRTHEEIIESQADYHRVTTALHETTRSIVEAGCSREPIQATLW